MRQAAHQVGGLVGGAGSFLLTFMILKLRYLNVICKRPALDGRSTDLHPGGKRA